MGIPAGEVVAVGVAGPPGAWATEPGGGDRHRGPVRSHWRGVVDVPRGRPRIRHVAALVVRHGGVRELGQYRSPKPLLATKP